MKTASGSSAAPALSPEVPGVKTAGVTGKVLAKPTGPAGFAPGAGGAAKFQDSGGAVIEIGKLQLIFWGSAWNSNPPPSPTSGQVTGAVETILHGSYMTGLAEYRQIGRAYLAGSYVITSSNPPNPFTDSDVGNFITTQINNGVLPGHDFANQNLYLVIMPKGVNNQNSGFIGEHTYYTDGSGNRVHFGWITNNGDINSVTSVFSHELVESCTDPEGSAILGVAGTCSQGGWCEIGDVCYVNSVLDGVTVQKYYSNADSGCIAPVYPALSFPIHGTQFTGTIPANATERWFTYNWPEIYFVQWEVVPTTPGAGPQISYRVQVERPNGAYLTYWISITNLTNQPVSIEAHYNILGR
jgi:hypothetical protein